MHNRSQHPIEVVVAVGNVLTVEGAGDRVPEAEDAYAHVIALGERPGEPQSVVAALVAIRRALQHDKDVHPGPIDCELMCLPELEIQLSAS